MHGLDVHFSADGQRFSATYLPDVPLEQGWSKRETLCSLVRKTGYTGVVSDALLSRLKIRTYQSSKSSVSYDDWVAGSRGVAAEKPS